ncbi:hypothetical protein H7200_01735 [Candidatus Saccharibacteria bacterium]|nr:hypothetical protein [Candidatus Saccharibacteria bacterium]
MSEQLPNPSKEHDVQPNPSELNKTIYVKRSNGEISTMRIADNAKVDDEGKLRAYLVENDEEDGSEYIAGYKPISERALSDDVQNALAGEYAANNTPEFAEVQPLSEAQEDLADEAIEGAIGVVDPSEIDDNAQMFSSSDIRRMREAAERVIDTSSMITSEEVRAIAFPAAQEVAAAPEAPSDPVDVLVKLTEGLNEDDLLRLRSYAESTDEVREAQKDGRGEDSTYWQQTKGQALRAMSPKAQSIANRYAGFYNATQQ